MAVKTAYSKHRRDDLLPIRPALAERVREFVQDCPADEPLFAVPEGKTAKMIRVDLKAAGIPYHDGEGRVLDFHSLRHTTGSWLAAKGMHPKVIHRLMRHGTITLTMDRYTHLDIANDRAGLDALPKFEDDGPESLRATGTDDQRAHKMATILRDLERHGVSL